MNNLFEIEKFKSLNDLLNTVEVNKKVNLTNVKGGLQGFIAYLIFLQARKVKRDVLYIVPTEKDAREKYKILSRFITDLDIFPPEQLHYYFSDAVSLYNFQEREQVLKDSVEKNPLLVVTTFEALLKKLPSPEEFKKTKIILKVGEDFDFEELTKKLASYGYERSPVTESPGQFSVRGEIIDIYPITESQPIRIDFFDNEVESISYFDSVTQRSSSSLDDIKIVPLGENWLTEEERELALEKLNKKYKKKEKFEDRLDTIYQESPLSNSILSTVLDKNSSLIDYLKDGSNNKDPIIIWGNPSESLEEAQEYLGKVEADYSAMEITGEAFPEELKRFFSIKQLKNLINECPLVKMHLFSIPYKKNEIEIDMDSRTIISFAGQPKVLAEFLRNRINHGFYIRFFAKNQAGLEKIQNYLNEIDVKVLTEEDEDIPGVRTSIGEITEGFELAQDKVIFLNESDFFKAQRNVKKKRDDTKKIESFTDLKVGDLVVHDEYGIGKYLGLIQMDMGDSPKDMMKLEYGGGDILYIPIENMDVVQAYIGTGEDKPPKLNEIGSNKWSKEKAKAKKAAEDMADELIALYSKRQNMEGFAYSKDTVWQQDFEDAFPFDETDDQLQSIQEIKEDMEKTTSMDRLLCGDVGYGKTEVAFRAAFKAVMDHKQVAILVPTTVLAQQHYLSAVERFKDFPVNIEVMSRFKPKKEQKEIVEKVKNGEVDILIGTHRIISKDINFKDLGLLIIDEEQRFGVKAKETIKQLKENIDVLTLSATPIPRTLHMSLSGVRNMSVLEQPPSGRRPVQTYVMNYSPSVIKDAIERELNRNGQVYYIHNRVHDIDQVKNEIQKLVPAARIITAHGKMTGKELEKVMYRFLNKEYDILLATTIIENGIDVRNANTMIVEDGENFGLSQLYQLRGRVGRGPRQAYAYITHKRKNLKEDAVKRLQAIRDFTAFGSGFKVAMRDLEIRGAGNLLGKQQSGHLAKIGYELYTRILQQAINERLTGEIIKEMKDSKITSDIQAYVPSSYIVGDELRYEIYKKIALLRTWEDFDQLEEELTDRFGKVPQSILNLMLVAMIKNIATLLDVESITQKDKDVKIIFNSNNAKDYFNLYYNQSNAKAFNLNRNPGSGKIPSWEFELKEKNDEKLVEIYSILEEILEKQEEGNKIETTA